MTDKMKLGWVFAAMIVALMIQLAAGTPIDASAEEMHDGEDLRLRVIAHSDDSFDQVVKRVVVFAVEGYLNQHENGHSPEFIVRNMDGIRLAIDEVLAEIHVETEIDLSLEHHYFADSLGYYMSLIVRIGDANGENWWCFINPGVCTAPNDETATANTAQIALTEELQDSFGTRVIRFVGGLFGGRSAAYEETAMGEINWFLFDDER
ncbi:MAG: stage II sporulation protein R [Turicibacter sp.]|nr:stage II sporulation protein R [Turicibacter sp.]